MTGDLIFTWWAWAVIALVLLILEVLIPAFLLLGFGIGAGVICILLMVFGPAVFLHNIALMLAIWATLSLVAWLGLRHWFRPPDMQVKTFSNDINDN